MAAAPAELFASWYDTEARDVPGGNATMVTKAPALVDFVSFVRTSLIIAVGTQMTILLQDPLRRRKEWSRELVNST